MSSFAFVFPGQGSQSVGMLDAWGDHPAVVETLKEASDAMGEDLGALIHHGPQEALGLTTNTQPVMLVSAIAAYRAWLSEGGAQPAVVAGHSLGEYSALVAAGVLTLAQAAPLVRFRAAAMQDAVAVGVGAMAAVLGMDAAKVIEGCAQAKATFPSDSGEVVEAVNFNDPAQIVIAGSKAAVETDADRIRDALYRQAFGPVRWVECVEAIKAQGVTMVLECGPGKVLAGMVKRIDPDMTGMPVFDPASLAEAKGALA